jgi:hypothetical protein
MSEMVKHEEIVQHLNSGNRAAFDLDKTSVSYGSTSLVTKVCETEYCANRDSLSDLLSSLLVDTGLTANRDSIKRMHAFHLALQIQNA